MPSVTYRFSGANRLHNFISLAVFALFVFTLVITLGLGAYWLELPLTGWIKVEHPDGIGIFWPYLGLTIVFGLFFAFTDRLKSSVRNYLSLDDTGLTYAYLGMRRTWFWRDIDSADVLKRPFGLTSARLIVSGKFAMKDRFGMLMMNGIGSPHRMGIMLPDFYETPITDIVATIAEYRDRAVGPGKEGMAAARTPPPVTATPGQSLAYEKHESQYRFERGMLYLGLALCGLVMLPMIGVGYLLIDERPDFRSIDSALVVVLGLLVVSWPFIFIVSFRRIAPGQNRLTLDEEGLTYIRQSTRYHWPWRSLSVFDYQIPPTATGRPIVTFAAPGRDWTWWLVRLRHGLFRKAPAVVVEDMYETPLDEIAATLNAYRENALGGGG